MRRSVMALRVQHQKKRRRRWLVTVVGLAALVWGLNYFMIIRPVAAALAQDERTAGVVLSAHLRYFVDPTTIAFNLGAMRAADTTDVFIALFVAAKGLNDHSWGIPGTATLSRGGDLVYTVAGDDLRRLAHDFAVAPKPAAALIALVQALRGPDGKPLGPAATVESAGRRWVTGRP